METQAKTIQVSFRLPTQLVTRLRKAAARRERWPQHQHQTPSQTDIVIHGLELVLRRLEKNKHGP